MSHGTLVDLVRCMGCRACQVACKAWNDNSHEITICLGCYDNPPAFSPDTWSLMRFTEAEDAGKLHWVFSKLQCMHCFEPGCVTACPVKALEKRDDGPVIYHDEKCIGCRYCMVACPFGVPTFDWDEPVPYIHKCTFCADRLDAGLEPACVKACPTGALEFGERNALLAEARGRILSRPEKYLDHIYGEEEVGGTSWLYIAPIPFDKLGFIAHGTEKMGFPSLGTDPVGENAERALLMVPPTIVVTSAVMAGFYWFTKRRDKMSQAKAGEQEE
jgi:formate dehydrogenase iron-sulfur subunit